MCSQMFNCLLSGTIFRHPFRSLLIPGKGMTHGSQIVFIGKLNHIICRRKFIISFRWLHCIRFHQIFRCNCIKMVQKHFPLHALQTGWVVNISNKEIVLVYRLKRHQGPIYFRILFLRSLHITCFIRCSKHYCIQIKIFPDSCICCLKVPFQA